MYPLLRCIPLAALGLTIAACSGDADKAEVASPAISTAQAALRENSCSACHSVSAKGIGPSMADVAAKYDANDRAKLIASIRQGSSQQWGKRGMPAQPQVSPEAADALVTKILALKSD